MNLVPDHNSAVTLGSIVANGSPARGSHLATVDQRTAWLGFVAHPMTPHVLRGSADTTNTSGGALPGVFTSSDHGIDLIIPPGVAWLQWGVIALGTGPIRMTALSKTYQIEVSAPGSAAIEDAQTLWAVKALPTYAADQPAAIDCTSAVTAGARRPRLLTVQIDRPSGSAAVIAHLFRYLVSPPGTDLSAFAATGAGGTEL